MKESTKDLIPAPGTGLAPVAYPRPDEHPAAVYLARLAPGSRRAMRQALDVVAGILAKGATAETLPWHLVRYQHVQLVRRTLEGRYRPAAANKVLAALRGVLREAFRLGLVPAEDHQRVVAVEGFKGSTEPRGRALKMGEWTALFAACDPSTAQGARDAALLAVLYGAGLRRSEAVALDVSDYDPETGALTVRRGKGSKERTVYATNGARDALRAWLDARGHEPGPLFCGLQKGGELRPGRLTDSGVYAVLQRIATDAKVKAFSPHDCRRSYITALLQGGAPITVVSKLAGHASVSTTARYDRSGEDAKRKAAELLHVPFAS